MSLPPLETQFFVLSIFCSWTNLQQRLLTMHVVMKLLFTAISNRLIIHHIPRFPLNLIKHNIITVAGVQFTSPFLGPLVLSLPLLMLLVTINAPDTHQRVSPKRVDPVNYFPNRFDDLQNNYVHNEKADDDQDSKDHWFFDSVE